MAKSVAVASVAATALWVAAAGTAEQLTARVQSYRVESVMPAYIPQSGDELATALVTEAPRVAGLAWEDLPRLLELSGMRGSKLFFLKAPVRSQSPRFPLLALRLENSASVEAEVRVGDIRIRTAGREVRVAGVGVGMPAVFLKRSESEQEIVRDARIQVPPQSATDVLLLLQAKPEERLEFSVMESGWRGIPPARIAD